MIKKVLKWIMWTFIKGLEMIGITILVLSFVAGLAGLAGVLLYLGWTSGDYLILLGIVVGCIFIYGLIYRGIGEIE